MDDDTHQPIRSSAAGGTDYQGVPLAVLVEELADWADMLADEQVQLAELVPQLEVDLTRIDAGLAHEEDAAGPALLRHDRPLVHDALHGVRRCIARFRAMEVDFRRLALELPGGVLPAHLTLILTVEDRLAEERQLWLGRQAPGAEPTRVLVDRVELHCRQPLADLLDLSNVRSRLETFVGVSVEQADAEANDEVTPDTQAAPVEPIRRRRGPDTEDWERRVEQFHRLYGRGEVRSVTAGAKRLKMPRETLRDLLCNPDCPTPRQAGVASGKRVCSTFLNTPAPSRTYPGARCR